MSCQRRFRILTPNGMLSGDTFVLPPEQPRNRKAGCTLVIHERTGSPLTVHDTRLFPAEAAGALPIVDAPNSVSLNYDRVRRVIEVRLNRPDHDGSSRGMVEPNGPPSALAVPIPSPLMDYRRNLVG